jgi:hypothetical protein
MHYEFLFKWSWKASLSNSPPNVLLSLSHGRPQSITQTFSGQVRHNNCIALMNRAAYKKLHKRLKSHILTSEPPAAHPLHPDSPCTSVPDTTTPSAGSAHSASLLPAAQARCSQRIVCTLRPLIRRLERMSSLVEMLRAVLRRIISLPIPAQIPVSPICIKIETR